MPYLSASKRQWPLTEITKYTKCSIYATSPQELVGSFDRLLFDYTTITSFHFSYSDSLSRGPDVIAVYLSRWISFPSVKSSSWEDESTHWFLTKDCFLKSVKETSDLSNDQIKVVIFTFLSNQGRNTLSKSLVHRLLCWLLNCCVLTANLDSISPFFLWTTREAEMHFHIAFCLKALSKI